MIKYKWIIFLPCVVAAKQVRVAVPTTEQLAWQDLEIGAMIGFNLQSNCFATSHPNRSQQPCVSFGTATGDDPEAMAQGKARGWVPDTSAANEWSLPELDTDTWAATAKSFGAKYAIVVAQHMSGFSLWDTRAYNFSMASTKHGSDLLGDLIRSCRKYGLKIGFFYSVHFNWWLGVHDYQLGHPRLDPQLPNLTDAAEFLYVVKQQLTELATLFGIEGPLEIWLDGGPGPYANVIGPILRLVAPNAVCHSCLPEFTQAGTVRWMGNENGIMQLPSWSAAAPLSWDGDPLGQVFAPASADVVLREHFWFWANTSEGIPKGVPSSSKTLVHKYLTSVGRNANLILNVAPDGRTGRIHPWDTRRYREMGAAIGCLWSQPLASSTSILTMNDHDEIRFEIGVPVKGTNISVVLREDQTRGQLIGNYTLLCGNATFLIACSMGSMLDVIPAFQYEIGQLQTGIGHKRILMISQDSPFDTLVLKVWSHFSAADQRPALRDISLYDWSGKVIACV